MKIKWEREIAMWLNVNGVVPKCFTEKVTVEQKPEGSQPHRYLGKSCFIKKKRWKWAWYGQEVARRQVCLSGGS